MTKVKKPKKRGRKKSNLITKKLPLFLDMLRETPYVKLAAERLGLNLITVYDRRRKDPAFSKAWDLAMQEGIQACEGELWRRGVVGTNRFVVSAGKVVTVTDPDGQVRHLQELQYSDQCLITLLKKHDAGYRDNKTIQHTGKDGGPIEVEHVRSETTQLEEQISAATGISVDEIRRIAADRIRDRTQGRIEGMEAGN